MFFIIRLLPFLFFMLLTNLISGQVRVINNEKITIVGEVRNFNNPQKDFQGNIILNHDFVASLGYSVIDRKRFYKLKFLDDKEIREIEFYATKTEIEDLYRLIFNDYSKPQMEFKTEILLGEYHLLISTDWLSNIVNSNEHVLSLTIKDKGSFSLYKHQLNTLFGY